MYLSLISDYTEIVSADEKRQTTSGNGSGIHLAFREPLGGVAPFWQMGASNVADRYSVGFFYVVVCRLGVGVDPRSGHTTKSGRRATRTRPIYNCISEVLEAQCRL
jgi:hypothetical protein